MGPTPEKRWFLPAILIFAAACLFLAATRFSQQVIARPDTQSQDSQTIVVPIQIEREIYGIAMIDKATQTLWIYELNNRGPAYNHLKLFAARNWKYDKFLQQYNTAEPKPEQVRMIIENLGGQEKRGNGAQQYQPQVNTPQTPEPNQPGINTEAESTLKNEPNTGDLNNILEESYK
jgi:hypothetical protein